MLQSYWEIVGMKHGKHVEQKQTKTATVCFSLFFFGPPRETNILRPPAIRPRRDRKNSPSDSRHCASEWVMKPTVFGGGDEGWKKM